MGDTEEQQATKDALAIRGKWRDGKSYSGLDLIGDSIQRGGMAGMPGLAGAPAIEQGVSPVDVATQATAPVVGSTLGRVAGSRFGPLGRIIGSGVGAVGGSLFNVGAGITDSKSIMDALLEAGVTGLGAMGGQAGGEATTATARVGAAPFAARPAPGAAGLRQTFDAVGVDPTVADFSPNMAALERSVAQTPTGGQIIRDAADTRALQLTRAKDEFLDRVAPAAAGERVAVGEKASASIVRHVERTGALEDVLWTQMGNMATDMPVDIRRYKAAAADILLKEKRGDSPNTALVALAERVLAMPDVVPWQVADATRKQRGRGITTGELISGLPSGENKYLHRELLLDMEAAADASDVPGVRQGYRNLRDFSEHRRAIFRDGEVAKILETDPEKVVSLLNAAGGPTAIKRAREGILGSPELGLVTPSAADLEAWNYVRRHILEGVFNKATNEQYKGLSNPVIVGSRLDKALKAIGDDGLKELLTDTERTALKNITAVAKAMRASESTGALPGTSTTPQGMGFYNLITGAPAALGGLVGGVVGGGPGAAIGSGVAGTGAFILVPHITAKILTNPKAAALVASPAFAGLATGTKMTAAAAREGTQALARLAGILFAQQQGGE